MQANLVPTGQHAASGSNSPVGQFFINVQILAASNREQATILFGMLFTLVIWLFSALGLIIAILFYVFYLWYHIPSSDGSLAKYCRRKVDKRLSQIVGVKINKAIERENRQRLKEEAKSDGKSLKHQPTVPIIGDEKAGLSRHTSQASFWTDSRFGGDDERRPSALPGLNRPTPPSRVSSQTSAQSGDSYASDAPLMVAASAMGYDGTGRPYSPAPLSKTAAERSYQRSRPGLSRLQTQISQRSHGSYESNWSGPTPMSASQITLGPYSAVSPDGAGFPGRFAPISKRSAAPASFNSQPQNHKPVPRSVPQEPDVYEMQSPDITSRVASQTSSGYTAYNPAMHARQNSYNDLYSPRSATAPPQQQYPNFQARPPPTSYFGQETPQLQRSGTAPIDGGKPPTSAAWAAQRGVMDRH